MKPLPIIGHLVTFAVGCGLAALLVPAEPGAPSAGPQADGMAATKNPRIPPGDLLAAMAAMPMTANHRDSLKSQIVDEWSRSDATGLLAYLDGRPRIGHWSFDSAFSVLAESKPQELLRYARENGCPDALTKLLYGKDPRATLSLLLESTSASYPSSTYERLFEAGEQLDPDFHRRIAELPDAAAKKAAFASAAEVMRKNKRHDDFFELVEQFGEHAAPADLASGFAEIVLEDHGRLKHFNGLPESARPAAAKRLLGELHNSDDVDQACKELLPALAEMGWLEAHRDVVAETVLEEALDAEGTPDVPDDTSWKEWALDLPEGKRWDFLRDVAMARWVLGAPGNIDRIASLPTSRLQDAARVGAILHFMEQEQPDEAKRIAGGIEDPRRRAKFIGVLEQTEAGEEVEDFDPFE